MKIFRTHFTLSWLICSLLSAFCLMQVFSGKVWLPDEILVAPAADFAFLLLCFLLCGAVLLLFPVLENHFIFFCFLLFACLLSFSSDNEWLCIALCVPALYLLRRLYAGQPLGKSFGYAKPLLISGAVLFFLFVGGLTSLRYFSFHAPNFDFGIFAQMFEQMRRTGLPFTTCERNRLLSHFAVHISPVWYLLLPLYLLFPHPVTLQLAQAGIVTLAVIPLYRLARLHLPERCSVLLCLAFFLYPALSGSCFYDIHENCFLVLFLLYMIYGSERRDSRLIYVLVPAVLTCLVKEDAPIFVAVFGFYRLFDREKRKEGILLFLLGCVWFTLCLFIMNRYGEGVFTVHYSSLLYSGNGMIDVILAILCNPAHVIAESFSADRILYLAQMLVPLCFLPLLSGKPAQLLLLIPFFLINLMPDYIYQHTIDFQYNFGNIAFFFYLVILAAKALPQRRRRLACAGILTACLLTFCGTKLEKLYILSQWAGNRTEARQIQQVLDTIPSDASAAVSSMFAAHLWQQEELYQLPYSESTDYVAIDLRYEDGAELQAQYDDEPDYQAVKYIPGLIRLYQHVAN